MKVQGKQNKEIWCYTYCNFKDWTGPLLFSDYFLRSNVGQNIKIHNSVTSLMISFKKKSIFLAM